jgi:rhodanese-related sulfurtransferase
LAQRLAARHVTGGDWASGQALWGCLRAAAGRRPASKIVRFAIPRNDVKFIIDNWYLILIAVASGVMLLLPTAWCAGGSLSAAAAVHLINREKAVVLDVCEPEEFAAGHVNGARNLPLSQLEEKLPTTVKNKQLPVVLVCASGARAVRAEAVAKKLGYEKAQALAGGMKAWRDAGLPVEKA